eukprot:SAG22_NODE_244_length_14023_cov_45.200661_4_plen_217_part_00
MAELYRAVALWFPRVHGGRSIAYHVAKARPHQAGRRRRAVHAEMQVHVFECSRVMQPYAVGKDYSRLTVQQLGFVMKELRGDRAVLPPGEIDFVLALAELDDHSASIRKEDVAEALAMWSAMLHDKEFIDRTFDARGLAARGKRAMPDDVVAVLTALNNDIKPRPAELEWVWAAVGGKNKAHRGFSRPQLRLLVTIWYFHVEPMRIAGETGRQAGR